MARPLRIEYPGAGYHVTSRGIARQDIVADDRDRPDLLGSLDNYDRPDKD
jgi:putative transposase